MERLLSETAMKSEEYQEKDKDLANQVLVHFKHKLVREDLAYEIRAMRGASFYSIFIYKVNQMVSWDFLQDTVQQFNIALCDLKILFEAQGTLTFVIQLFFAREVPKNANIFALTRYRTVINDFKNVLLKFPEFQQDSMLVYRVCDAVYNSSEFLPVVEVRLVDRRVGEDESVCDIQFVNLGEISYSFLQYLASTVAVRRMGKIVIVPTHESRFELRISLLSNTSKMSPLSICHLFHIREKSTKRSREQQDGENEQPIKRKKLE